MTGLRVHLTPRDVPARLRATCSDVALDAEIIYPADRPPLGTDVQRRIDSLVRLPSPAWFVSVGGLELCFLDGVRLSSLALYANFALAKVESITPPVALQPVWLTLPDFDPAEDERFRVDAIVNVSIDRPRGAIRLRLADGHKTYRSYSVADGVVISVDSHDRIVDVIAQGIEWTASAPIRDTHN